MEILHHLFLKGYFLLFVIIATGIAVGKLRFKGFQLDFSAVIFVALFFGALFKYLGWSIQLPKIIQDMGLVLFIYTIGMQAGPSFFSLFKTQGKNLFILACVTVGSAAVVSWSFISFYGLDVNLGVGLFAGALSSSPGLAAAIEASGSPLASIGYGIAYPFGVIGVILFVKISVKLFGVSVAQEEENYTQESRNKFPSLEAQNFKVTNQEVFGKTIQEIQFRQITSCNISRVLKAGKELVTPEPGLVLEQGDVVRVVGSRQALKTVALLLGAPSEVQIPRSGQHEIKWYLVTNEAVVNKQLRELNLMQTYRATVTRIRRSGVEIAPQQTSILKFGDKVLVSSTKGNVQGVTALFGDCLKRLDQTSFLPVALGIVIGVLLGEISIPLFGIDVKLGLTGGVLFAALFLSHKGKTGPIIWNLSGPANQLLRQLGLLLFLTPVGLAAGAHIKEAFITHGIALFFIGALITLVPLILTTLIGKYVLHMNFLSLLGGLMGGMTSTPGLSAVDSLSESNAGATAYAAVYPVSLVLLIFICQAFAKLGGSMF